MSSSEPAPRQGTVRRRVVVTVCLAALLVPFALTFVQLWSSTGSSLAFTAAERDGVVYLRPLVRLIAASADAQSTVVAGGQVDLAQLRDTQAAVDAVDKRLGGRLATTRRWGEISTRIDALATQATGAGPGGEAAFASYTQLIDLEVALNSAVGDSSNLILDPDLDSYYVMDATLLRVPTVLVESGRVNDLSARPHTDALAIEVARAQVRNAAAAMDTGLRKSFASTRSTTLGTAMLTQIDRFRVAVATLAPSTSDVGAPTGTRTVQQERATRLQVRDAALAVEAAGLDQLDLLLAARQDADQSRRTLVLAATIGGAAVALLALWALGSRRRPSRELGDDPHGPGDGGSPPRGDLASDARDHDPAVLGARELLDAQRLVRVGRAVSRRERT